MIVEHIHSKPIQVDWSEWHEKDEDAYDSVFEVTDLTGDGDYYIPTEIGTFVRKRSMREMIAVLRELDMDRHDFYLGEGDWDEDKLAVEFDERYNDADDHEGPMMNYAYPIALGDWLGHDADPWAAAMTIADLPLCVVKYHDNYYLALTGGGMDFSWEICEAYVRLGYYPPYHFCDLPKMSGRRNSAEVVKACLETCRISTMWTQRTAEKLREDYAKLLTTEIEIGGTYEFYSTLQDRDSDGNLCRLWTGQTCKVLRRITEGVDEAEVGPMYEVEFADGTTFQVLEDEIDGFAKTHNYYTPDGTFVRPGASP